MPLDTLDKLTFAQPNRQQIRDALHEQATAPAYTGPPSDMKEDDIDDEFDEEKPDTGLGTGTIISAINSLTGKSTNNVFDCIIVNVATIVRNNTTKERSPKEIQDRTEADIRDLITCVANYHEVMGPMVTRPMLMFFLPDYSWIPLLHKRPDTGNRKVVFDIVESMIKQDDLRKRKRIRNHERATELVEIYAGGRAELPYKTVIREIQDMHKLGGFDPRSNLTNYLLISHCPADYHFMLNFSHVTLLESFTGKFIKPKTLGYKVFGTNFIPFNSVTHLLFGDKVNLRPMAMRKNRALLTNMAKTQSWYVRTPSEIAQFVGASGQVEARILTYLKL